MTITELWTQPMPLENPAGLRVGYVITDGRRVRLSACGQPYGGPAHSFTCAAQLALGGMPPILANDWRSGIARTLSRHGYSVDRDAITTR